MDIFQKWKLFSASRNLKIDLTDIFLKDEDVIIALFLETILQAKRELKKLFTDVFLIFQDTSEYEILEGFLKHGAMSKNKLSQSLNISHDKLYKKDSHYYKAFNKLVNKGIIIVVKELKRGTLYDIAPEYRPILKLMMVY